LCEASQQLQIDELQQWSDNENFYDSETVQKLASLCTKTEALINGVISPHIAEVIHASRADIPFCGVATDASNHLAVNVYSADSIF
jgi:hypothetical protein